MKISRLSLLLLLPALFISAVTFSQDIQVNVQMNHPDWTYTCGDTVEYTVEVLKSGTPLEGAQVDIQVGPERMPARISVGKISSETPIHISAGSLDTPGFLRCIARVSVDGKTYRGLATAAFEPEKIQPTTFLPGDFHQFWDSLKRELSRVPLHADQEFLKEKSTAEVHVYQVRLENIDGNQVYGILSVPAAPGKFPAILKVPGAGVRSYAPDIESAKKGFIVLRIGIHGVPVNKEKAFYTQLARTRLKGYPHFGSDDRQTYYFKHVYLGCIRALDFLTGLPQYDGKRLGVSGGSQGGALTIVTASLDHRVKALVAYFPGLCDLTGYLHGRTGGWPHTLKDNPTEAQIQTSRYYDVVNFARDIKVPGFYSWGFNDETCPPTSCYAAYNQISAPKELLIVKESGHAYQPVQREKMDTWLQEKLLEL